MIPARDAITDSPPSKPLLPDSYLLNAYNLSSTPTTKTLHPLIEDESPTSPLKGTKVSKALFEEIPVVEQLPDTIKEASKDLAISFQSGGSGKEKASPNSAVKNQSQQKENTGAEKMIQNENMNLQSPSELGTMKNVESVEQPPIVDQTHPEAFAGLKIGDTIELGGGLSGNVRFLGVTQFSDGVWAGLALTTPNGIVYFSILTVEILAVITVNGIESTGQNERVDLEAKFLVIFRRSYPFYPFIYEVRN